MKYTAALIATVAVAQAAPVDQVCKIVTSVVYGQPTWVPNNVGATWSAVPSSPAAASSTWASWTSKTPADYTKTTSSEWASWSTTKATPEPTSKTTSGEWASWSTTKATPEPTSKTTSSEWASWTATTTKSSVTTSWAATTKWTTTSAATTTTSAATTTTTTAQAVPTCGSAVSTTDETYAGYNWELYCGQGVDQTTVQNLRAAGTLHFWENGNVYDNVAECEQVCAGDDKCTAAVYTDDPAARPADYKHCWMTDTLPRPNQASYGQISYKLSKA